MIENKYDHIKKFIIPPRKYFSEVDIETYRKEAHKEGKNWSLDLKIGSEYFLSAGDVPEKLNEDNEFIIIKPGKFGSLITAEVIDIDDKHIGLISVKFSFKQKGLINVSGFTVDPNYKGNIIFTVFNAGPRDIYIKRGDYVFMICFLELKTKLEDSKKRVGYNSIPSSVIDALGGNSLTLTENNKRIEQLEFYVKIIAAVAIGLIAVTLKSLI